MVILPNAPNMPNPGYLLARAPLPRPIVVLLALIVNSCGVALVSAARPLLLRGGRFGPCGPFGPPWSGGGGGGGPPPPPPPPGGGGGGGGFPPGPGGPLGFPPGFGGPPPPPPPPGGGGGGFPSGGFPSGGGGGKLPSGAAGGFAT